MKVGDIIEIEGKKYLIEPQKISGMSCKGCDLHKAPYCNNVIFVIANNKKESEK